MFISVFGNRQQTSKCDLFRRFCAIRSQSRTARCILYFEHWEEGNGIDTLTGSRLESTTTNNNNIFLVRIGLDIKLGVRGITQVLDGVRTVIVLRNSITCSDLA